MGSPPPQLHGGGLHQPGAGLDPDSLLIASKCSGYLAYNEMLLPGIEFELLHQRSQQGSSKCLSSIFFNLDHLSSFSLLCIDPANPSERTTTTTAMPISSTSPSSHRHQPPSPSPSEATLMLLPLSLYIEGNVAADFHHLYVKLVKARTGSCRLTLADFMEGSSDNQSPTKCLTKVPNYAHDACSPRHRDFYSLPLMINYPDHCHDFKGVEQLVSDDDNDSRSWHPISESHIPNNSDEQQDQGRDANPRQLCNFNIKNGLFDRIHVWSSFTFDPKERVKSQVKVPNTMSSRGNSVGETVTFAKSLRREMQRWFRKFVEDTLSVGLWLFGEVLVDSREASCSDNRRSAAGLSHLRRVYDWLDAYNVFALMPRRNRMVSPNGLHSLLWPPRDR